MIPNSTLKFLKQLSANNSREWFAQNKAEYLTAQLQFKEFIEDLLKQLIKFDRTLEGVDAGKTLFRIYRDVRFSKDKTPYKINFASNMNKGGKNSIYAGYYLHIQPGNQSFAAAGSYLPQAEHLNKIRQEIDYHAGEFKKIVSAKSFKNSFGELEDFKMKTIPKGYAMENPSIEFIQQKSFIVSKYFTDKEVKATEFKRNVNDVFKSSFSLVNFINRSLD